MKSFFPVAFYHLRIVVTQGANELDKLGSLEKPSKFIRGEGDRPKIRNFFGKFLMGGGGEKINNFPMSILKEKSAGTNFFY